MLVHLTLFCAGCDGACKVRSVSGGRRKFRGVDYCWALFEPEVEPRELSLFENVAPTSQPSRCREYPASNPTRQVSASQLHLCDHQTHSPPLDIPNDPVATLHQGRNPLPLPSTRTLP
ncbi:hypothetical protein CEXT_664591 [Caerostris extrusa]|uniref:Uncharacterized protein n=1 Tax=Caerostris extrusa TaxID=172846 RepID=A0AAV4WRM4_CAEEX|nr:hypothetical protein CEXT_664591 [Caerostris extrusa]